MSGIDNQFVEMLRNDVGRMAQGLTGGEVCAADMLRQSVDLIPCLLEPIFQQVGIAAVVGSSDTGKSSFLRELAVAVVAGLESFIGFRLTPRHRRAVYVSTEDDECAVSYLLRFQNQYRGLEPDRLKELYFIFETENLVQHLDTFLTKKPADLVVVDAFADIYNGSMNENNRVRAFLQEFNQLAQRHKCLILFLHHTGKRTEDMIPSKHNAIGSQGFEAKMRIVAELRSDFVDPAIKHFCIVKGNYLPAEYKSDSYVLRFTSNMTFEHTGSRTPFDELKRTSEEHDAHRQVVAQQIRDLQKQGLSNRDIAQKLGYRSHTSISRILERS